MKTLIIAPFLFIKLFAGEIFFQGPCEEKPFLKIETSQNVITAGELTIKVLDEAGISYIGSEAGMNSIDGTPIGREAVELVADGHLRAYGWCYEIDGFQPAQMPDQIELKGSEQVRWFFAYSTYKDGVWKDYCTPSYSLKSPFICQE